MPVAVAFEPIWPMMCLNPISRIGNGPVSTNALCAATPFDLGRIEGRLTAAVLPEEVRRERKMAPRDKMVDIDCMITTYWKIFVVDGGQGYGDDKYFPRT